MKIKVFIFLIPILVIFLFAGCMTPQVELRMEYDKLVKAITAERATLSSERKLDFLKPAANDEVREVLEYIWTKTASMQTEADEIISLTTFGFSVTNISKTEKTVSVHFVVSVVKADGPIPVMLKNLDPSVTAPEINLHWYRISNESDPVPVYNLIFSYVKDDLGWKISNLKDSGIDVLTVPELLQFTSRDSLQQ